MSGLGMLHYFFGIEVPQMEEGIFIYQTQNFNIADCKAVSAPLAENDKM